MQCVETMKDKLDQLRLSMTRLKDFSLSRSDHRIIWHFILLIITKHSVTVRGKSKNIAAWKYISKYALSERKAVVNFHKLIVSNKIFQTTCKMHACDRRRKHTDNAICLWSVNLSSVKPSLARTCLLTKLEWFFLEMVNCILVTIVCTQACLFEKMCALTKYGIQIWLKLFV